MTNEFKKAFNAEMSRLGILCMRDNPVGVVVSQAEDEEGRSIVGYVRVADDYVSSVVKETEALRVAREAQDSDEFWSKLNDVELKPA